MDRGGGLDGGAEGVYRGGGVYRGPGLRVCDGAAEGEAGGDEPEDPDGEGDGDGLGAGDEDDTGVGDGDGAGRGGRAHWLDQETWIVCAAGVPWSRYTRALPPPLPCRLTVTSMVTLCPADSTPPYPLSEMSPDDVPALQVAGPPRAESTIEPCDPEPTSSVPGVAVSVPGRWPGEGGGAGALTRVRGRRGGEMNGGSGDGVPVSGLVSVVNTVTPVDAVGSGSGPSPLGANVGCAGPAGSAPMAPAPSRRDSDEPGCPGADPEPCAGPLVPPATPSTITDATAAAAATAATAATTRPRGRRAAVIVAARCAGGGPGTAAAGGWLPIPGGTDEGSARAIANSR